MYSCGLLIRYSFRIYATPSLTLRSCGSVGMSLLLWVLGAMIAAAGTAVFIELGTVRVVGPLTAAYQ